MCEEGFSFSLFYYPKYKEDPKKLISDQEISNYPKEYIVSTGPEQGRPGFAIYRQGGYVGAVVSTGSEMYQVEVFKLPTNNTWTNLAIRWEPFKYIDDHEKFAVDKEKPDYDEDEVGGLQLFYNLDMVSKAIVGIECMGICNQDGLDPREMIVGCHKSSDNTTERYFATGRFDELAFWTRRLNNTEKPLFLGGHSKSNNSNRTLVAQNFALTVHFSFSF